MLFHSGAMVLIGWKIDQMEASVAPPRLIISSAEASDHRRGGNESGIQSPLSMASRRLEGREDAGCPAAYSASISIKAGTVFHKVTECCSIIRSQAAGSRMESGGGMTTAPPAASRPKTS